MGRKKRSIESDSERLSPPSKMNKNDSQAILAKLDSLESRFSKIEQEVLEIKQIVKTIEGIRAEVEALKESRECFQRLEIESKKRCVLIRGLKFKSEGSSRPGQRHVKPSLVSLLWWGLTPLTWWITRDWAPSRRGRMVVRFPSE